MTSGRHITQRDSKDRMTQVEAARAIIAHIAGHLQADLCVELWNGEVLPLGEDARSDIRVRIASPAAIGRLVRSPKRMTLIELYLAGDIDIVGGSLAEAFTRYDHLRSLELVRGLDRKLILRNALPFLLAGTGRSEELGFAGGVSAVFGRGRNDASMVSHHYDVSNAFYALFLDATMQYSAGYFATPDVSLDDAQVAKLDRICRKLQLAPGQRLFDLGCGWGGLACHAAEHYGAAVHGVTLSQEQFALAQQRVRQRKLDHLVTIELRDYRSLDTPGAYDAVSQIGMFEHVGLSNHDGHFAQIHRLLKAGGLYMHQSITRRAPLDLASFRKPTSYMQFINRYIFPRRRTGLFRTERHQPRAPPVRGPHRRGDAGALLPIGEGLGRAAGRQARRRHRRGGRNAHPALVALLDHGLDRVLPRRTMRFPDPRSEARDRLVGGDDGLRRGDRRKMLTAVCASGQQRGQATRSP